MSNRDILQLQGSLLEIKVSSVQCQSSTLLSLLHMLYTHRFIPLAAFTLSLLNCFKRDFLHKYWIKWSDWVALACFNNGVHGAVWCHVHMIPPRTMYIVSIRNPTPKNHSPILKYEPRDENAGSDHLYVQCGATCWTCAQSMRKHPVSNEIKWTLIGSVAPPHWIKPVYLNEVFWLGRIFDKLRSMHVYCKVQFIHGCLTVENNNMANESFC